MFLLGKGEAKAKIQFEMTKKWQQEWEAEPKARQYYNIQKQDEK